MSRHFIPRYIYTLIICSLLAIILIAVLLISLHKDKSTDSHNFTASGFNSVGEIPNSKISQTATGNQLDYASRGGSRQRGDDDEGR